MSIRFLALESVVALHQYQSDRYGGVQGLRDVRLLQSAVAAPAATFAGAYLHGDLFEMAAAYLFHVVQNHPFFDGNKRVGAAAAAVFLEINDRRLIADPDKYTELTLSVARGELSKSAVSEFFRANTGPV